jgi:prepilin-type N-terminal cleavage/methylation domain-containing protein
VLKNENLTPIQQKFFKYLDLMFKIEKPQIQKESSSFWKLDSKNQSVNSINPKTKGNPIMYKKKLAFTLAEVLITLGIIGVVAALTIPNLLAKYQEKQTVEKLSVSYAKLVEAFRLMIEDNGTIDTYGSDAYTRGEVLFSLIPKYINGVSKCSSWTSSSCRPSYWKYKYSDDTFNYLGTGSTNAYKMLDGSIIYVNSTPGGSCTQNVALTESWMGTYGGSCGSVHIDLNGISPPNTDGKDFFSFAILKDGIYPYGSEKETVWTQTFANHCLENHATPSFGKCTAWVLKNKNMEYLRCRDLNWNKKIKCSK